MFYIVECTDRTLVLENSPVMPDGSLSSEFIEYYFGDEKYAERDIVQISGPHIDAEIKVETRVSTIRAGDGFTYIGYDMDAGEWTE